MAREACFRGHDYMLEIAYSCCGKRQVLRKKTKTMYAVILWPAGLLDYAVVVP